MAATRERLRTLDLRWAELPVRWNLDPPKGLARVQADPWLGGLTPER